MKIPHLTLIGVGLIGGSLALDLRRAGLAQHIHGIDPDEENLRQAQQRGIIDSAATQCGAADIARTDIAVIAAPVAAAAQIAHDLAAIVGENTVITDVGSTKQNILEVFRREMPAHFPRCVAAHPIAGSEQSGAAAARYGLFVGQKTVLCPHTQQHSGSLKRVRAMWESVGAQVHIMDAAQHDAVFAAVSHLPHLLAYAYMHRIAADPRAGELLSFAASGFRDFTRIAASRPAIWADAALANRDCLLAELAAYRSTLENLHNLLQHNDHAGLAEMFSLACRTRRNWQKDHSS